MPDADLIPPGQVLATAPPPAAGLRDVLTRATRRRRRRQAGLLASVAAVGATALTLSLAGGAAVDSLGVTTPAHQPQPGSTVGPTAAAAPVATPAPRPSAAGAGQPMQPGPAPTGAAAVRASKAAAAAADARRARKAETGPPHTVTAYDPSRSCNGDGPTLATGWCSYYDGATSGVAGTQVELAAVVCRVPGNGQGVLQADSGQQAVFSAFQGGHQSWSWAAGRSFSSSGTTFTVVAGTCLRWYVPWSLRDNGGHRLSPGKYDLTARPYVHEGGDTSVVTNANLITFTVR